MNQRIFTAALAAALSCAAFAETQPQAETPSMLDQGVAAYQAQEFKQAASIFEKLAAAGDARAQSNLGVLYLDGSGVPADRAQAVKWFEQSAAQNYQSAKEALEKLK